MGLGYSMGILLLPPTITYACFYYLGGPMPTSRREGIGQVFSC